MSWGPASPLVTQGNSASWAAGSVRTLGSRQGGWEQTSAFTRSRSPQALLRGRVPWGRRRDQKCEGFGSHPPLPWELGRLLE